MLFLDKGTTMQQIMVLPAEAVVPCHRFIIKISRAWVSFLVESRDK